MAGKDTIMKPDNKDKLIYNLLQPIRFERSLGFALEYHRDA